MNDKPNDEPIAMQKVILRAASVVHQRAAPDATGEATFTFGSGESFTVPLTVPAAQQLCERVGELFLVAIYTTKDGNG